MLKIEQIKRNMQNAGQDQSMDGIRRVVPREIRQIRTTDQDNKSDAQGMRWLRLAAYHTHCLLGDALQRGGHMGADIQAACERYSSEHAAVC